MTLPELMALSAMETVHTRWVVAPVVPDEGFRKVPLLSFFPKFQVVGCTRHNISYTRFPSSAFCPSIFDLLFCREMASKSSTTAESTSFLARTWQFRFPSGERRAVFSRPRAHLFSSIIKTDSREGSGWYNSVTRTPADKADMLRALAGVERFLVRAMYQQNQLQSRWVCWVSAAQVGNWTKNSQLCFITAPTLSPSTQFPWSFRFSQRRWHSHVYQILGILLVYHFFATNIRWTY